MTWQMAKAGFASLTRRVGWRRLAQGVVILFLLTHQAWAGAICHCQGENGSEQDLQMAHACCAAAHHADFHENQEQAAEIALTPATGSGERTHATDGQHLDYGCNELESAAIECCQAESQLAVQGISIPSQNTESIVISPAFVSLGALTISIPIHQNAYLPHRTRPLYLSFSCLLI